MASTTLQVPFWIVDHVFKVFLKLYTPCALCTLFIKHQNCENVLNAVTFQWDAYVHHCWHQRYIFATMMLYGWNRLGIWCIQFLEHLRYIIYYSEWYLQCCRSHNVSFFDLFCKSPKLSEIFPCFHMFKSLTTSSFMFLVVCATDML